MAERKGKKKVEDLGFGRLNYILMAVGLGFIVIGYIFLAAGDITFAPILLVLGYCGIIPAAILIAADFGKSKKAETVAGGGESADK